MNDGFDKQKEANLTIVGIYVRYKRNTQRFASLQYVH